MLICIIQLHPLENLFDKLELFRNQITEEIFLKANAIIFL